MILTPPATMQNPYRRSNSAVVNYDPLRSERRARRNHLWLIIAFLTLAGLSAKILYLSWQSESTIWGILVVAAGLLVAATVDDEFDLFSPGAFVGLSIAFLYGPPLILSGTVFNLVDIPPAHEQAMPYYPRVGLLTLLCLLGFVVGYRNQAVARKGSKSRLLCWYAPEPTLRRLFLALIISSVWVLPVIIYNNAAYQTTTELQSPLFNSFLAWFEPGLLVATGLAVARYFHLREQRDPKLRTWRFAAIGCLCGTLAYGLMTGAKAMVLFPFITAALAWNYAHRRVSRSSLPWIILVGAVLMCGLLLVVQQYRLIQVKHGSALKQGVASSLDDWRETFNKLESQTWDETSTFILQNVIVRLDFAVIPARVLDYFDNGGEPKFGETYARFLYAFIPRILWRNKPGITIGLEVGGDLGLAGSEMDVSRLGRTMSTVSVGITLVGEAIYNFYWLAPLMTVLIGMMYRFLYEQFRVSTPLRSSVAIGLYSFVWYTLVFNGQESNMAGLLSGTMKYGFVLFVMFKLLGVQQARLQPAPVPVPARRLARDTSAR